jgi:hypothetical protein
MVLLVFGLPWLERPLVDGVGRLLVRFGG